jgi:glycine betaine/proline transport system substrate-binding protein
MRNALLRTAIGAVLSAGLATGAAAAEGDKTVELGWVAWSSTEMTTKLAKEVIEQEHGYDVELTLSDAGALYQGVAQGDVDAMLVSWQPETHADYVKQTNDDTVNLGVLYGYAKLGWVVPEYIPEDQLSSISDLKKESVRNKLDGAIQGIDPGAGLTRLSKTTIEEYDLDYDLKTASGAAMTAALKRAIRNEEWIVATGWSPHWKFGAFDIRYLEDPKGTLGKIERDHVLAREGFYQDNPEVALTLSRMFLDINELQAMMYEAQQTSYEKAAEQWVANHPERVDYWAHNEIPGEGDAS